MKHNGQYTCLYASKEDFVVPGATPLLIGRPILKAMKLQLTFMEDTVRVDEGPWTPIVTGSRGEHLVQLDQGLQDLPDNTSYEFDYMMEETFNLLTQHPAQAERYTLQRYIELTGKHWRQRSRRTTTTRCSSGKSMLAMQCWQHTWKRLDSPVERLGLHQTQPPEAVPPLVRPPEPRDRLDRD